MRVARPLLTIFLAAAAMSYGQDVLREAAGAMQRGDASTAIRLYREFLKDHAEAAEIRSNLGAALAQAGQFSEAIEEYKLALSRLPNQPQVRVNLGLAYVKLGQYKEAAAVLGPLHEKDPFDLKAGLLLGESLLQSGDLKRAVDVLTPLADEFAEDRAVAYLLGMALLRMNLPAEAQAQLDRILKDGESAEAEFLHAQIDYSRQNLLSAVEHAGKAVKLNPKIAGAHGLYGQVLLELGKQDEALAQYRAELEVNPYDFAANNGVATADREDSRYEEALLHIDRALRTRPNDPGARFQRAKIFLLKGDVAGAQKQLEDIVRDHPDFVEAHASLATIYYKQNRKADGDRERAAARPKG